MTAPTHPDLLSALRPFRVELDDRGLLPVARAREALLQTPDPPATSEQSDLLWAAVLSLSDVGDLCRATRQLSWEGVVRGSPNVALVARYGDSLIEWLRTRVEGGVLLGEPACVQECLLELGTSEALALMLGIEGYAGAAPQSPKGQRFGLLYAWVARHPEVAALPVFDRAQLGEGAANDPDAALLRAIVRAGPSSARRRIANARGEDLAAAVFERLSLPRELTPEVVLQMLDTGAKSLDHWPQFSLGDDDRSEYFGLRLLLAKERGGDTWGLVLERLSGSDPNGTVVERFVFDGFGVRTQQESVALEIEGEWRSGVRVVGPAGPLEVSPAELQSDALLADLSTEPAAIWRVRRAALRGYLAHYPESLWPPPEQAFENWAAQPVILLCTSDFEHVASGQLPSESECYQSAARVLATGEPAEFRPGVSNTHWRHHALFPGATSAH